MKTENFRFTQGKLYELSKKNNAYIFVGHFVGMTKKQAIKQYEINLYNDQEISWSEHDNE